MKKFLLSLLALCTLQAFASVPESRDFNFADPFSFSSSPGIVIPTGIDNADVLNVTSYTFTNDPVTMTFAAGTGVAGAAIHKSGNTYSLTIRNRAKFTIAVGGNCSLSSVEFLDGSDMGDILVTTTDNGKGEYSSFYRKWTASQSNVSSITFENGTAAGHLYRVRVNYNRPATPLTYSGSSFDGRESVVSFSNIQLYFNTSISSVSSTGITISGPAFDSPKSMTASYSGSTVTLSVSPAITKDGTYTIHVPANVFTNFEGASNSALTVTVKVYAERATLTGWTVSPEQGTYTSFPEKLVLTYPDVVALEATGAVMKLNGTAKYGAVMTKGDEDNQIVITPAKNPITDEGEWTVEIPEKAIHNSFLGISEEYDRWNPAFTLTYTVESAESAEMKKAKELLSQTGLGYPSTNSHARVDLQNVVNKGEEATEEEITTAITAFYNETDVTMPVADKWYTIAGVNSSESKLFLTFTADKTKVGVAASAATAAAFKLKSISDGVAVFETKEGKFLHIPTVLPNYDATSDKNLNDEQSEVNNLTLAKFSAASVEGADPAVLLGKFTIYGSLGKKQGTEASAYAMLNHDTYGIATDPTMGLAFDATLSSAFVLAETSEPVDDSNKVTPEARLNKTTIDKAGDELVLTIHYVKKAELITSNASKVHFNYNDAEKSGQTVPGINGANILTTKSNTEFSVNTTGLSKGMYVLVLPANSFTFTVRDEDEGKTVSDEEMIVTFSITEGGTTPNPDPDPDPDPDPNPDPDPDPTNFSYTFKDYGVLQVHLRSEARQDYIRDVDLNDFVIIARTEDITGLVPNPNKVVNVVNYYASSSVVGYGHFEEYNDAQFKRDYPDFSMYKAIKLVMDMPIPAGELQNNPTLYAYEIPAAAFGDANYGKWLNNNSSVAPSLCEVNPVDNSTKFQVNNDRATTGIVHIRPTVSADNTYYDLQGRKVEHTTKGVYIVNGKKIYVK